MAHHPGGLMRNPDTAHEDEAERYYRDAFRFGIDYMRERIPYGELRRRVDIERMNEAAGKRGEP